MKRVLVTGATGFVGQATICALKHNAVDVYVLGRTPPSSPEVNFYEADLLDPAQVASVVATVRPDGLIHLGWNADTGYWRATNNVDWLVASLHLVRCFADAGGHRIVVAGTCAEYQWGEPRFHETATACVPATLYGAAKDALRRVLFAYAQETGLSVAWARLFYLYGPGEKHDRLVSGAVRALLRGEPFETSAGTQKRDFLHVDDVAAAFVAIYNSTIEGAVNVGSGEAVTVRSLLERIAENIGGADLIQFGARSLALSEPTVIEADIGRLQSLVGFSPSYDLDRGLADTIAYWKAPERLS